MKIKKIGNILLIVLVVLVLVGLMGGCKKKKKEEKVYKKNPVMVKVQAVDQGPVVQSLNYKGTVFPWKRANIQPDTSGRIHKIYKKQGDQVKEGDLLAELDTTTLKLQLKQADAALEVATAAHKDASMNVDRLKKLYQKAAISKLQLEKAELNLESALTQKQSAQATVNVIEHTLGNCYMRAPFDGIVTSKNSEEGDVINPMMGMGMSSSVLTLMHLKTVKVVLDVPSEDIEKVAIGQPCTIRVSTLEAQVFNGEVYSRNLAADPVSKTFKVEVKIKNRDLKIKVGVFAEVFIEISRKENCLILPLSALIEEGDDTFAVVYDKGQAKFKNIRVGERNDRVFEIREGLSRGQLVVVEGNYDLKDGAPITYKGANQ
ncbi:MAG: efflux RND transporter periplasmic adaptor subunit [Candidatus Aminicenantes bacterium]|nr:MAG: efflux RND transporter periplasmic adaptor subunit [Candidatus Aminicenantes bacterium]